MSREIEFGISNMHNSDSLSLWMTSSTFERRVSFSRVAELLDVGPAREYSHFPMIPFSVQDLPKRAILWDHCSSGRAPAVFGESFLLNSGSAFAPSQPQELKRVPLLVPGATPVARARNRTPIGALTE